MKDSALYYNVGALLYCPANNTGVAGSIINNQFGKNYSLALCLEDTISDYHVKEAEVQLLQTIQTLFAARKTNNFFLPMIFIRVRTAKQIPWLIKHLGDAAALIRGFIIPKFSLENADEYIDTVFSLNEQTRQTFYLMPILESPSIISLKNRPSILYTLKEKLDAIEELVLNIRVGGNDLCHMFGFRRHSNESIHQISPIANIFSDIITVFGMDYVVSGPVWEYYSGPDWDSGLEEELNDDRLCGFIGKTVIHPKQIPLVNAAYKVSQKDLDDAKAILNWDTSSHSLVSGNTTKERMNEYKTHVNWANKILFLSQSYGVKEIVPTLLQADSFF